MLYLAMCLIGVLTGIFIPIYNFSNNVFSMQNLIVSLCIYVIFGIILQAVLS